MKGCHEQVWIAQTFEIEFSSGFRVETRQHLIEDVEVGLALGPPHHSRLFQHQSLNRSRHNLTGSVEIDAHQLRKSEMDLNSFLSKLAHFFEVQIKNTLDYVQTTQIVDVFEFKPSLLVPK